ncbi:MAG: glycerophosphodiester phosphodiesterase family protein [Oscillospiraceae bacterium]
MKKSSRFASVLLATIMLFSMFGLNVFAAPSKAPIKAPAVATDNSKINEIVASFNNPNGRLMSVASKGNWRNFPENSLEGIQSCIDIGVDIVAVDIQRTKDGKFVLMSDKSLSRMCVDKDGRVATSKVSEETLDEIKEFYFLRDSRGGLNAKPTNYKVPSLEEAITLSKGKIMIMIDNAWKYGDEVQSIIKSLDADEIVILRGAKTAQEISAHIQKNGLPISHISGYYEGVMSYPAKKYIKETISSGAKIIELTSPNSYSSLYSDSVLKKFVDNGRAFVSTISPELCGGREDLRSDWSDLVGRGYSVIETNYPKELVNYIKEIEGYRSSLSSLITQAQGINTSNYSKDSSKSLKSALNDAEELSSIGSTSLDNIDVARYNLQQAIDSMTPRSEDEDAGIGAGAIAFIVILVIALLGAVAFFIWKKKNNIPPTSPTEATGETPMPKKKRRLKRRKPQKQRQQRPQPPADYQNPNE